MTGTCQYLPYKLSYSTPIHCSHLRIIAIRHGNHVHNFHLISPPSQDSKRSICQICHQQSVVIIAYDARATHWPAELSSRTIPLYPLGRGTSFPINA